MTTCPLLHLLFPPYRSGVRFLAACLLSGCVVSTAVDERRKAGPSVVPIETPSVYSTIHPEDDMSLCVPHPLRRDASVSRSFGSVPLGRDTAVDHIDFVAEQNEPIYPVAPGDVSIQELPNLPGEYVIVMTHRSQIRSEGTAEFWQSVYRPVKPTQWALDHEDKPMLDTKQPIARAIEGAAATGPFLRFTTRVLHPLDAPTSQESSYQPVNPLSLLPEPDGNCPLH